MLLAQLEEVSADAEAHALVRTIDASCALLQTIVGNVLTLKQLQRGAPAPLAHRAFDPRAAVAAAAERAAALYPSRRVALCTDTDTAAAALALPDAVYGDAEQLGECVTNVLVTALRLSSWERERALRLTLSCAEAEEAEGVCGDAAAAAGAVPAPAEEGHLEEGRPVVLNVAADVLGRPLTQEECDTLLQPFGLAPHDKGGGSGLALHVARGVARGMGGDVWLEPRGGRGGGGESGEESECTRVALRVRLCAAPRGAPLGESPRCRHAPLQRLPSQGSMPQTPALNAQRQAEATTAICKIVNQQNWV
jgi:signal transduction histidine kinase